MGIAASHQGLSDGYFSGITSKHLPVLSILFALWVPGNLQTWRV
jgi:hypothetical protein